MRRIERAVTLRAHWLIAPTAAALAQSARDLGLARIPERWHCVPHARPNLAPADGTQQKSARNALGYGPADLVILGVGRLVPLKCFDRVVRACAAQGDPRLHLMLLGAGDSTRLHALAAELGFGGHLRIETAHDVSPYYHAADMYVSASSTESFGMANLEALCAGLPAICTAVGGVPEVVGDGAWLVPNDVDVLTRALGELAADAQWRATWSRRAIERTARWPTAQEIAERYVAIYQAT